LRRRNASPRNPAGRVYGIGKPEHLKHFGGNVWLRRINDADRLVYEVFEDRVAFLQARYHYG
jgi:Txe/YoeB family toxin of toxin-antitoxin system